MPVTTKRLGLGLALATLAALAAPAHAGDGVFEINQTCATTTGCFPGDSAGFPVSIGSDGAYQLTSELTLATADQSAIQVSLSSSPPSVTIDLRGFAISGVTTCTGEPAACTGIGSGIGIRGARGTTIRNGTVRGMGDVGVNTGAGSTVENLLVEQNGNDGVRISYGASRRTIVRGNRILKNGGDGIAASFQDGDGNYAGNLVEGNVVAGNGKHGIRVYGGAVTGNVAANNLMEGLDINSTSGYVDNLFLGNKGGNLAADQVSTGAQLGGNVCSGVLCP
jgi:hypothetical protein